MNVKNRLIYSIYSKLLLAAGLLIIIISLTGIRLYQNGKAVQEALQDRQSIQALDEKLAAIDETKDQLLALYGTAGLSLSTQDKAGLLLILGNIRDQANAVKSVDAESHSAIQADLDRAATLLKNNPFNVNTLKHSLDFVNAANLRLRSVDEAIDAKIAGIKNRIFPIIQVNPYGSLWVLLACLALVSALAVVIVADIVWPLQKITGALRKAGDDPDNMMSCVINDLRTDEVGAAQIALNTLLTRVALDRESVRKVNKKAGRLVAAIEASHEGIGMIDPDGTLVYANDALLSEHGVSEDNKAAYIGQSWLNLYTAKGARAIETSVLPALHDHGYWKGETQIVRKDDGLRDMDMTLTLLADGSMIGTARDVTDRKIAEKEKDNLQQLLAQSQKMQAIGRLTGGVAHDFNNLLTIVRGNLELLSDCPEAMTKETKAYVLVAQRAVDRGAELTRRLLSYARQQILTSRTTDLNAFLPQTAMLITRILGEQIDLVFDLCHGKAMANIDSGQLESALLNLSINARDAMPDGGTITISTSIVPVHDPVIREGVVIKPANYIQIKVNDTGFGISPDILNRVFDPFFTTKNAGHGTGLGLSMVYGFVKQSGGYIFIESEVNKGTSVVMFFESTEANADELVKDGWDVKNSGKSATILMAEDEEDVLNLGKAMLDKAGYKVYCARNGQEALKILKAGEPIDLLLTDIMMPGGLNGYDLADEARKLRSDIKVLFVSGYASESPMNIEDNSDFRLLFKPYTQAKLRREIENLLESPMEAGS